MDTCIIPGFTSSTPGIVNLRSVSGLSRHIRHVDYKIRRENGSYILNDKQTVNSSYTFKMSPDSPWRQLTFDLTDIKEAPEKQIKGIEDLRFFNLHPDVTFVPSSMSDDSKTSRSKEGGKNKIYGMGTTAQYSTDGNLCMVICEIDAEKGVAYPIKRIPRVLHTEKNHAPITGTNLCVHSWGPTLKIYDMMKTTEDSIHWTHEIPDTDIPAWFRDMRGSSCGIPFPSSGTPKEYWFVCHRVFHETPRRYVHCIVRLDAVSLRPVGLTIPFQFDEYQIEFVGGIAFDDNDETLVIGYSIFDSSSREIRLPMLFILRDLMLSIMANRPPPST